MNCVAEILFFFFRFLAKNFKAFTNTRASFFLFEKGTPIWLPMYLTRKLETHTYREQASEVLFHIGDTKKKKKKKMHFGHCKVFVDTTSDNVEQLKCSVSESCPIKI